jgi:uncharacterized membrane protein
MRGLVGFLPLLPLPFLLGISPPRYTAESLGSLVPVALNAAGETAGMAPGPAGLPRAAVQLATGLQVVALARAGVLSVATGLSDGDAVAGYVTLGPSAAQTRAFLCRALDDCGELPTLGDDALTSHGLGLNNALTVVGDSTVEVGNLLSTQPTLWLDSVIQQLPTLGGEQGFGLAIDQDGNACGESQTADGVFHATLWPVDSPDPVDLDTIGSLTSRCTSLSAGGQVGVYVAPGGASRPFHVSPLVPMHDAGLLSGFTNGMVNGINGQGVFVGSNGQRTGPPFTVAVGWFEDGSPVDLNTLLDTPGWVLLSATKINDTLQIVGVGLFEGTVHGFLLTPVAEVVEAPRDRRHRERRWRHGVRHAWGHRR